MDIGPRAEREVPEGTEPEVVATVTIDPFSESYSQPDPEGVHVALQQGRSQKKSCGIDEDVLERVCILDCPAVWRLVLVVLLVDVLVQQRCVECSVKPVEAEVFNQEEQGQLHQSLLPAVCVCVCVCNYWILFLEYFRIMQASNILPHIKCCFTVSGKYPIEQ